MSVLTPRRPGAPPAQSPRAQRQNAQVVPPQPRTIWWIALGVRIALLVLVTLTETLLLLAAVVPTSIWAAHGYPNGPIPSKIYPVAAGLFYLLPTVTGALCRRWPAAVVLATLPAWADLAAFAIVAAPKVGPFYFVLPDHSINTVGTLELFAILGALGWMARTASLAVFGKGDWRVQ